MAKHTDSPMSKCPKCQQSPCVCEEPEGNGSKGLDSKVCDKCGSPMEGDKCGKDGCGTKAKAPKGKT